MSTSILSWLSKTSPQVLKWTLHLVVCSKNIVSDSDSGWIQKSIIRASHPEESLPLNALHIKISKTKDWIFCQRFESETSRNEIAAFWILTGLLKGWLPPLWAQYPLEWEGLPPTNATPRKQLESASKRPRNILKAKPNDNRFWSAALGLDRVCNNSAEAGWVAVEII